ncbi:hypothetical protein ACSYAY_08630 [Leptospirillum ferriphilum]|jgi:hypothetical protein|uniref:Uncharacterized protein n=1 Tax=Leptospirillum ferriphilum TaxID=178606 RepID=A0A094X4X7_9BACT|nr:hypothetical protein [Leptospirillum ferriphilum]KGA93604.1 hypothetical protein LptCag_0217 [Leptospirillum ferriphilum]
MRTEQQHYVFNNTEDQAEFDRLRLLERPSIQKPDSSWRMSGSQRAGIVWKWVQEQVPS